MWGIIGGSGFEKFDEFETVELLKRETPFGLASSGFKRVKVAGQECLFISRHGDHHELMPTEVNFRANIYALKAHGVKAIMSFSAVGSLRAELEPGHMVVPYQYIDRTKGIRKHTFCGEGIVGHMSLAHPVCKSMAELAQGLAKKENFTSHFGGTYVCIEGPNFSTLAESMHYRDINADIIGMTHFPEYALAREAGMSYLPCCFVTDYDCWDQSRPHVTIEEVIRVMRENNKKGFSFLKTVLSQKIPLYANCDCEEGGLRNGLMVPAEKLTAAQREWLDVLRK